MNQQQQRLRRPRRERRQAVQTGAPLVLAQPDGEQADFAANDAAVLEIIAERIGERTKHDKVEALDDERIYNENQQRGGQ